MEKQTPQANVARSSGSSPLVPIALIVAGIASGAGGIYVGETDDAPGAALLGLLLMIGLIVLGVRIVRRRT